MEPIEIKISLMRAGISQTEIARRCGVSVTQVKRVIFGSMSCHIREEIAKAIGMDVAEIWPEHYKRQESVQAASV